jgi:hypothetical protein
VVVIIAGALRSGRGPGTEQAITLPEEECMARIVDYLKGKVY